MYLDRLRPSRWYPVALAGFGGGLVCGLLFALSGPVPFMRLLGLGIMTVAGVGLALCVAGLKAEDPASLADLQARARDALLRLREWRTEARPRVA